MADSVLVARDVYKAFTLGRVRIAALAGVSLTVERGEIVAIMGPSGCGKTTLLHCLAGLEEFERGDVLLEGKSLRALSDTQRADQRARRMGFVFQSFNLLPVLSALENVELPLLIGGWKPRPARERASEMLGIVGLADRLEHRPSELSGGQQQRVALARALAPEPAVVFADEPTGNLDSAAAEQVMRLITDLNRRNQQTIVLVTHAPEVAGHANRTIHMLDGQITRVESGTGSVSGASTLNEPSPQNHAFVAPG